MLLSYFIEALSFVRWLLTLKLHNFAQYVIGLYRHLILTFTTLNLIVKDVYLRVLKNQTYKISNFLVTCHRKIQSKLNK